MTCKPYDIPKTLIWEAWLHVKANQGAAGIDAETIERFEKKLGDNLYKLWNRMSSGSHVPPPVKAVSIPKKSGAVRILGIRQDRADDGEDVAGANLPLREWFLASVVEALLALTQICHALRAIVAGRFPMVQFSRLPTIFFHRYADGDRGGGPGKGAQ